jgi:phosphopantetheinyl transferase
VTAPSARKSSGCSALAPPGPGELHLWLGPRAGVDNSDVFLRSVLVNYTETAPEQLRIARGAQGKPALSWPALALDFNLSGSGDWLAIAVSDGAAVGVDIQYCDPGREVITLARRFFRDEEVAQLQACAPTQRSDRFYDYWTLKEAHIKAAGGSLGLQLESTGFLLRYPQAATSDRSTGSIAPLVSDATTAAWYGLLQPFANYRLALCCHSPRDFSAGIRLCDLPGSGYSVERPFELRAVSRSPHATPESR